MKKASGGEKKRMKSCSCLCWKTNFALLDEIDSGLDIDALKVVSKGQCYAWRGLWRYDHHHYQRLLNYITPDVVHVMMEGKLFMQRSNWQFAWKEGYMPNWLKSWASTILKKSSQTFLTLIKIGE